MNITFYKLSGAGNDFIGITNMNRRFDDEQKKAITRRLCPRRTSVGADGTLFIEPAEKAHFTMRYYNADGTEAETCGNGARCIARLAYMLNIAPQEMRFDTQAGLYTATVLDDREVRVSMSNPTEERHNIEVKVPAFNEKVDFINTGVPHVVVPVTNLDTYPVVDTGRALRHAPPFQPAGTNANFISVVQSQPSSIIRIRTYERGVEDETLACGTGCIASAVLAHRRFDLQSPVQCQTRGEVTLTIHFEKKNDMFCNIKLQGPALPIFKGEYCWQR